MIAIEIRHHLVFPIRKHTGSYWTILGPRVKPMGMCTLAKRSARLRTGSLEYAFKEGVNQRSQ